MQDIFWVDKVAKEVIKRGSAEGKDRIICASGITPSGIVHAGNFREYLTVAFVVRAIRDKGEKVEHLHFWDDYDRFRKVPSNVPKEFEKYIGMPVSFVPDPWDCHSSYSQHFISLAEEEMKLLGIEARIIYQSSLYQNGYYAEEIKIALENRDRIMEILNRFRKEPLPKNWYPIQIYCENCMKDKTEIKKVEGDEIFYTCSDCKYEGITSPSRGNVKLRWRIDWPARWAKYKVDFEPGGKEHSMPGSSRDTGSIISREIFQYEPPIYFMYNFISLKGEKGKMSSSKGNVITISELLKIYEPEVLRWLYLKTRPEKEFSIPLDDSVIPTYDEFDRYERVYFGEEEERNEREKENIRRAYQLSSITLPLKKPFRLQFGFAAQIAQLLDFEKEFEKVAKLLKRTGHLKEKLSEEDKKALLSRLRKAKYWVENYAPENFRISLSDEKIEIEERFKPLIQKLSERIKNLETEEEILKATYDTIKELNLEPKEAFQVLYRILIGKEKGPRFGRLVLLLGKEKVLERFQRFL